MTRSVPCRFAGVAGRHDPIHAPHDDGDPPDDSAGARGSAVVGARAGRSVFGVADFSVTKCPPGLLAAAGREQRPPGTTDRFVSRSPGSFASTVIAAFVS